MSKELQKKDSSVFKIGSTLINKRAIISIDTRIVDDGGLPVGKIFITDMSGRAYLYAASSDIAAINKTLEDLKKEL